MKFIKTLKFFNKYRGRLSQYKIIDMGGTDNISYRWYVTLARKGNFLADIFLKGKLPREIKED
jgi:hypothetical protein